MHDSWTFGLASTRSDAYAALPLGRTPDLEVVSLADSFEL